MSIVAKVLVSAVLIVVISKMAKCSSLFAAVLASLPVTSLLAFIWKPGMALKLPCCRGKSLAW